jgi:hypothetical protein
VLVIVVTLILLPKSDFSWQARGSRLSRHGRTIADKGEISH